MELNTTIRNENNTTEISTDRPNTDRPRGDRPRSDRPRGDRPRSGNFNRNRNNFNRRPEGAEPRRAASDPTTWNREEITVTIKQNATEFARENGLLREGLEEFTPTEGQVKATEAVIAKLDAGVRGTLIKAPTGAGKTEVEFQAAIDFIFKTGKPVLIISPTKELCRQSWAYFFNRLKKTPFYVRELHSGIAKRDRLNLVGDTLSGRVNVVIATAMILDKPEYKKIVDHVGLIIVDDVNAIDEETQLVNLERYNQPMVFATATPEKVRGFLMTKDAFSNMIEMKSLPFQSPPTTVHRVKSVKNEDIIDQVHRVWGYIDDHVSNKGRVFIISKTKRGVEEVEDTIREQYPDVPVAILHGDMVDTKKKSQALQRMGLEVSVHTRVDMMKKFRENLPAILVSTNLVGSGIDIPMADLMIVTDADGFSEDEIEQLIGRVGRRELASEAVLVYGTLKEPRPVRKPRGRGGFGGYSGGGNRDRDNRGGRGGFGGGGYGGGDRDNRGGGYNTNSRSSSNRHAAGANAPRTERSDRPERAPSADRPERSERPDSRRPSTEKPREIKGRTLSYFLK